MGPGLGRVGYAKDTRDKAEGSPLAQGTASARAAGCICARPDQHPCSTRPPASSCSVARPMRTRRVCRRVGAFPRVGETFPHFLRWWKNSSQKYMSTGTSSSHPSTGPSRYTPCVTWAPAAPLEWPAGGMAHKLITSRMAAFLNNAVWCRAGISMNLPFCISCQHLLLILDTTVDMVEELYNLRSLELVLPIYISVHTRALPAHAL
jgi:hypothetical protein